MSKVSQMMISTMRKRKEGMVAMWGAAPLRLVRWCGDRGTQKLPADIHQTTDQAVLKHLEGEHYKQGKTQGQSCRAMSKSGV